MSHGENIQDTKQGQRKAELSLECIRQSCTKNTWVNVPTKKIESEQVAEQRMARMAMRFCQFPPQSAEAAFAHMRFLADLWPHRMQQPLPDICQYTHGTAMNG